jgi:hypothetical protein
MHPFDAVVVAGGHNAAIVAAHAWRAPGSKTPTRLQAAPRLRQRLRKKTLAGL